MSGNFLVAAISTVSGATAVNILIASFVTFAVWNALKPPGHIRLRRVVRDMQPGSNPGLPLPFIAAVSFAIGVMVLMGSSLGILIGLMCGIVVFRFFGKLESREERERNNALTAQMPMVCDLLAATLASGASLLDAVRAVGMSAGDPAAQTLNRVERALMLGTPGAQLWSTANAEPQFTRIAAAFQRSSESGAPLAELLSGVAVDERRVKRRAVEIAARGAGVRSILPLAACYLPAFILLGVVPVVASMATTIFTS
jgi:Flp pilus assembly protein TadB